MSEPKATSSVELRELSGSDLVEALAWRMEVLEAVFAEDDPWERDTLRDANESFFQQHLGSDCLYCIASIDGRDAGCGAICLQDELPSPDNPSGKCAYVMNIYTRSSFRKRGVARAIVTWLIEKAHERGAGKIYLESTAAGHPLYESMGFHDMSGMMKLS